MDEIEMNEIHEMAQEVVRAACAFFFEELRKADSNYNPVGTWAIAAGIIDCKEDSVTYCWECWKKMIIADVPNDYSGSKRRNFLRKNADCPSNLRGAIEACLSREANRAL